jgi:D-xylose 1-dehydrogenase
MNISPSPSVRGHIRGSEAVYPSLKGKVVLISGGATGIGESIVRAFSRQDSKVAFVDIDIAAGTRLASELTAEAAGRHILFKPCDVTDAAALKAVISEVTHLLGSVEVLVNNAADDLRHAPDEVTPEFFDRAVAVNLRHQFFAAQAVAPGMAAAGGGSIINLGSISWMNTLVPGWVMTDKQLRMWVKPDSEREIDAAQCLPGRLHGEDIAAMALFLAADDSRMCTAQDFIVDAGWT